MKIEYVSKDSVFQIHPKQKPIASYMHLVCMNWQESFQIYDTCCIIIYQSPKYSVNVIVITQTVCIDNLFFTPKHTA